MFCLSANWTENQSQNAIAYKSIRDGEEYNLIGSTEHVEGRLEEIRRNGFAYCTYISSVYPHLGPAFRSQPASRVELSFTRRFYLMTRVPAWKKLY